MNDFEKITMQRNSIRVYDENCRISQAEMLEMLNETVHAPSSMNLQPWRFWVIDSVASKEKLEPLLGGNISQVRTSAAMILVFGDLQAYDLQKKLCDEAVAAGKMTTEQRDHQIETIKAVETRSVSDRREGLKLDCGLAIMQFMLVARAHGYDTCPIGAFDENELCRAFEVDNNHYVPVLAISIGKAAEAGHDKLRFKADDFTKFN